MRCLYPRQINIELWKLTFARQQLRCRYIFFIRPVWQMGSLWMFALAVMKITWNYVELREIIWNCVKVRGITWNYMELRESTWNYVKKGSILHVVALVTVCSCHSRTRLLGNLTRTIRSLRIFPKKYLVTNKSVTYQYIPTHARSSIIIRNSTRPYWKVPG